MTGRLTGTWDQNNCWRTCEIKIYNFRFGVDLKWHINCLCDKTNNTKRQLLKLIWASLFEKYSACGDRTMGGDLRFKRPRLWDCPNPEKTNTCCLDVSACMITHDWRLLITHYYITFAMLSRGGWSGLYVDKLLFEVTCPRWRCLLPWHLQLPGATWRTVQETLVRETWIQNFTFALVNDDVKTLMPINAAFVSVVAMF